MSKLGSKLFSWLHNSKFYFGFHQEVITKFPNASEETWLDFGCGAGVLTKLAYLKGYKATGFDYDLDMIESSKQNSISEEYNGINFYQNNLFDFQENFKNADIVSASSLLSVISNKKEAIEILFKYLKPNGTLVLIESNKNLTFFNAVKYYFKNQVFSDLGLILWGAVRNGKSTANDFISEYVKNLEFKKYTLTNGFVDVFIIKKV